MLLVNLGQSYFTELLHDEAYYWYYSQNLAWGYFDHPPMVAWMIALGNVLVAGELGVRLISCLMGSGLLLLLWLLIDRYQQKEFHYNLYVWLGAIVLLHAYGFLSLPDTPLLFFTALFLLFYRAFLTQSNLLLALALGLSMAALMYSKYHAALVILGVLVSNPSLIKNRLAWFALLVSVLAFTPHLYWLYEHDFVSIRFHFLERPNQMYRFESNTLGYLLNLLTLFGLTFPWVYVALFKFRPADQFEKALVYMTYGILLFFFISSFQRRVQTQWLIAVCIPVAIIVGRELVVRRNLRFWILRAGIVNLIILGILRVGLIYAPLFPVPFETHGNKKWAAQISKVSDNALVVFENSYRLPSVYSFYTGKPSFTLVNSYYRKNQYTLDASEAQFQGKRVFYIPIGGKQTPYGFLNHKGELRYGYFIPKFYSYQKLRAGVTKLQLEPSGNYGEFWVYNPYSFNIPLKPLRFGVAYLDTFKKVIQIQPANPSHKEDSNTFIKAHDSLKLNVHWNVPENAAPKYLRAVVSAHSMLWGINGDSQKLGQ
ncbi:MAG: hypothetical protein RLZZ241_1481 [Bacteroidota bacterium]|jgi:hypothetical protein